jgi:hypothetical protein
VSLHEGLQSWFEGNEASSSNNLVDSHGLVVGTQTNTPDANGSYRSFVTAQNEYFTLNSKFNMGAAGQAFSFGFHGQKGAGNMVFIGADNAGTTRICRIDYFSRLRFMYGQSPTFDTVQAGLGVPADNTDFSALATFTSGGVGTLYVNGVSVASDASPTGAFDHAVDFSIGALNGNGARSWFVTGRMRKIGFWNRALSDGEALEFHNGGLGWVYDKNTQVLIS